MKNLSGKNRKRRNRLFKTILLLIVIASVVGLQIYLTHEKPLPLTGNEVTLSSNPLLYGKSQEKDTLNQEVVEQKINLNAASLEDLMKLPGVGEKTAQRMLKYKEKNGLYHSIESVMEVKGIGPRKFEKIKSLITVE